MSNLDLDETVFLRKISSDDTENIIKWRNSDFVRSNFIFQKLFTVSSQEKWIEKEINTGHVVQFIIVDKYLDKDVGCVYLRDIDNDFKKAEYGIFIGEKDAFGRGIGTQAAKLIVAYAFEKLQLHKVFLRVFADNHIAIHSYKKAGFVQEGYFKDDVFVNSSYRDMIFMSIINPNDRSI